MKKIMYYAMLAASIAMMTGCSAEDPFEEYVNNGNNGWINNGSMGGGNGSSATTGELATFDVTIDKTSAEPTDATTAYFPDEEDALENMSSRRRSASTCRIL